MIRKIDEVIAQIHEVGLDQYGHEALSLWAKEIINECANRARLKYERPGAFAQPEIVGVDTEAILAIKKEIQ